MVIQNRRQTINIWLQKFVATVIFTPLVMVFSFSRFFNQPFLGIERPFWIIGISVLYLGVIVYHQILNPYFIYFNDNGVKLIIRFYPVRAFNQKKNAIEIHKNRLVNYKISRKSGKDYLSIFVRFRKEVGKYPSISLSALSSDQKEKIRNSLEEIIRANS